MGIPRTARGVTPCRRSDLFHPAVHVQIYARDVRRFRTREEQHRIGDFLRLARALHRKLRDDAAQGLIDGFLRRQPCWQNRRSPQAYRARPLFPPVTTATFPVSLFRNTPLRSLGMAKATLECISIV